MTGPGPSGTDDADMTEERVGMPPLVWTGPGPSSDGEDSRVRDVGMTWVTTVPAPEVSDPITFCCVISIALGCGILTHLTLWAPARAAKLTTIAVEYMLMIG